MSHTTYTCHTRRTHVTHDVHMSHTTYTCHTRRTHVTHDVHMSHTTYTCHTRRTHVTHDVHMSHTTYTCHTRALGLVHVHHVYHTGYPWPVAAPRVCRRSAQIDARRKTGASVNIPWTYLENFMGVHVPPVPPVGYAPEHLLWLADWHALASCLDLWFTTTTTTAA